MVTSNFSTVIIKLNANDEIYGSGDADIVFRISTSANELVYNIENFDCANKNQKLDFRSIETVENIFNLELDENIDNNSVMVLERSSGAAYIELIGINLEHLSSECFIIKEYAEENVSEL